MERELVINIICNEEEKRLTLYEYDTIGDLKLTIEHKFKIPTHLQIIDGWKITPESDCTILKSCLDNKENYLIVSKLSDEPMDQSDLLNGNQIDNEEVNRYVAKILGVDYNPDEIAPTTDENFINNNEEYDEDEVNCHVSRILGEPYTGEYSEGTSFGSRSTLQMESSSDESPSDVEREIVPEYSPLNTISEIDAAFSFLSKFFDSFDSTDIRFNSCLLKDVISDVCLAPLERRKALLLYFHNPTDQFYHVFSRNIKNQEVIDLISKHFYLMGWDVEDEQYHSALLKSLNEKPELSNVSSLVTKKTSAALFIVPMYGSVTVLSCMRGKVKDKDFVKTLKHTADFIIEENQKESNLLELAKKTGSENDIGSKQYQKLMADMLGDRDYDRFEFNEHDHLKSKIGFALCGPPQKQDDETETAENIGYTEKQQKEIDKLYTIIMENSNPIAEWKDQVDISFVYNCTEPLPDEKLSRAKKYEKENYNPNTDIQPFPIFVLRKCRDCDNPCRIFIDHTGRTYQTWKEYISKNKLHKCEMILPWNGKYEVSGNGMVYLEKHLSPACGIDVKVLQGFDIASTVGGLTSMGIFIASAIPAVAVAPAALVAGATIGAGVGVYSIGRSIHTLYDRSKYKETLSFVNSEARGAYLNIIAGSLGFVGAGANMVVSQLTTQGVNIGRGASAVVNTIGLVNIGAGGVSLVNSGYDVYDQWANERRTPSLLSIVQLSSSVLFFGNAVYNFKLCSTIVQESQSQVLNEFQESLRSNRHRKTFTKLLKETISQNGDSARGKAEVISAIKNIGNKDEVFAVLTRSNKAFNGNNIKISAEQGRILLNGIEVNMSEFASMNKQEVASFIGKISAGKAKAGDLSKVEIKNSTVFKNVSNSFGQDAMNMIVKVICNYNTDTQTKILQVLNIFLNAAQYKLINFLKEAFPDSECYIKILNMVIGYFSKTARVLDEAYTSWKTSGMCDQYKEFFEKIDSTLDRVSVLKYFFQIAINFDFVNNQFTQQGLKNLISYCWTWVAKSMFDKEIDDKKRTERTTHAVAKNKRVSCKICGGHYYTNKT